MKISTKGRYALRMMLDIAAQQGDGFVTLKEIAARQEISKNIWSRSPSSLPRQGCSTPRGAIGAAIAWRKPPGITPYCKFCWSRRAPWLRWPAWSKRPTSVPAALSAQRFPSGRGWSAWCRIIFRASRCRT